MKSHVLALAALAAIGFAGAASAENATTATAPKAMSDSEMDNVTAAGPPSDRGLGLGTAGQASGGTEGKPPSIAGQSGVSPGGGKYTAPGQQ